MLNAAANAAAVELAEKQESGKIHFKKYSNVCSKFRKRRKMAAVKIPKEDEFEAILDIEKGHDGIKNPKNSSSRPSKRSRKSSKWFSQGRETKKDSFVAQHPTQ